MPPRALKKTVQELLTRGELEEVAELATAERQVLGSLIALTFDLDLQLVWRAIEAMGMAVEKMAPLQKTYLEEHMRRLSWLITEEAGAVFWRAPECMAECSARLPTLFKSHLSIAFHLLETLEIEDLEHFRPGALWAVGRLADEAKDDLPGVLPLVFGALDDPNPQSRGMAVWCLGEAGKGKALSEYPALLEDEGPVHLYEDRVVETTTVKRLTQRVLDEALEKPN